MASVPDHFELAIEEARCRGADAEQILRIQALKWEFVARVAPEEYHRFAAYAAAVLFRSHEERAGFVRKATSAAMVEEAAEPGSGAAPARPPARLRSDWIQPLLAAGMVIILLGILLVNYLAPPPDIPFDNSSQPLPPVDRPLPISTVADMVSVLRSDLWWWAIVAAILAAGGAYLLWRYKHQIHLTANATEKAKPLADVAVRIGRNDLFAGNALHAMLPALRRPRLAASTRVDVARSVRATLAAAEPVVRFAPRRLAPEYLLLSEREVPQDHLPEIFRALGERFDQAHIVNARYEFQGDPAQVRLVSGNGSEDFEPLDTVLAKHEGAHLLVLMESTDALATASRWIETANLENVALLLNPREPGCWGDEERRLRAMGLPSFTASPEGMAELAEWLGRDRDQGPGPAANWCDPDLATFLNQHRSILISSRAPAPEQVDAIVENLERGLDSGAMEWLRTIALFPAITSSFTFFAGMTLREATLITHSRYLAIARLPWLRAGYMPDWLRIALVRGFAPDKLERAAAVIQAYLLPPSEPLAGRDAFLRIRKARESKAVRRKLLARLSTNENPLYADSILLGALNGQPPDALEPGLPAPALPRPWYHHPGAQVLAGLAAAFAVLCYFAPPVVKVPGDPPPVQPGPSATPSPNAAGQPSPTSSIAPQPTPIPTAPPTTPSGTPVIYIQINDASMRQTALDLVGALDGIRLGGVPARLPGIELKQDGPTSNQIRCFKPKTCAAAVTLQSAMARAGVTARIVRTNLPAQWVYATSPDLQYEVWLGVESLKPAPSSFNGPVSYFGNYTGRMVQRAAAAGDCPAVGCRQQIGGSVEIELQFVGNRVSGSFRGTNGLRESKFVGRRKGEICELFDILDGSVWRGTCNLQEFIGSVSSVPNAPVSISLNFNTIATSVSGKDTDADAK